VCSLGILVTWWHAGGTSVASQLCWSRSSPWCCTAASCGGSCRHGPIFPGRVTCSGYSLACWWPDLEPAHGLRRRHDPQGESRVHWCQEMCRSSLVTLLQWVSHASGGETRRGSAVPACTGREARRARSAGRPIGDIDLCIAGVAVCYGLTVVTNNTEHFARIPDLPLESWLKPPQVSA
jgi:hypothetical protein